MQRPELLSLPRRSSARQSGPVQAFSPLLRSRPGEQETDREPAPPRTAKRARSQPVFAPRPRTATLRASDTVCRSVSSRIFFPGSHPVRGVQVMKVGKLQLHQGMFPQAMKNLRLVSVRMRRSRHRPEGLFCLLLSCLPVIVGSSTRVCLMHTHTHTHMCTHTHAHKYLTASSEKK